jgi:hypothetical protein
VNLTRAHGHAEEAIKGGITKVQEKLNAEDKLKKKVA